MIFSDPESFWMFQKSMILLPSHFKITELETEEMMITGTATSQLCRLHTHPSSDVMGSPQRRGGRTKRQHHLLRGKTPAFAPQVSLWRRGHTAVPPPPRRVRKRLPLHQKRRGSFFWRLPKEGACA